MRILLIALLLLPSLAFANNGNIKRLDYEGFTIWLDCNKRAAVLFRYNAQRDTGNHKRKKDFYIDPNVPKNCQQKLSSTYKASGQRYDRGHLVPANHLDFSERAITQSNFMTNILPQAANMNRGAWLRTEVITECLRDISDLLVMGGPLWDRKQKDEFFERSHGVKTPDAFWKVIIRDKRVIAWIIPNSQSAKSTELDRYLVSVEDIERIAKVSIPVEDYLKYDAEKSSWLVPRGCNKG